MYSITLNNGAILDGLELNGNCYITEENLSESLFDGNLGTVKISDGEVTETRHDMVLNGLWIDSGKTWIALGEKTEQEKNTEQMKATITDLQVALTEIYEMILGGA